MGLFDFDVAYTADSVSNEVTVNRYRQNRLKGSWNYEISVFYFLYADLM